MNIGVFDSGVGGLTIFKDLEQILPEYNYVYLGDSLRAPYGGRDIETIYNLTKNACDYLFKKENVELIILACNTATATSLRRLQMEYLPSLKDSNKRILGIIRPIAELLPKISKKNRIGILGTKATINSLSYDEEIEKAYLELNNNTNYFLLKQSAPLFVPLVEEGMQNNRITKLIARQYLREFKIKKIDTLVLACTHYPILYKLIKSIMGNSVNVLLPGPIIAESLKEYLYRHKEIDILLSKTYKRKFLTTADNLSFDNLSSKFLNYKIKSKKINI